MVTIKGYSLQFRPMAPRAWRICARSDNPIMAPMLNELPEMVRRYGYGSYQIVQIMSDGRWSVLFTAELVENPAKNQPAEKFIGNRQPNDGGEGLIGRNAARICAQLDAEG